MDFSHGCYQALSSSPFFRREPGNEAILCPRLCPDVCSCACGLSGVDTLSQSLAVSSRTGIECVDLITGQNTPQPLLYLSQRVLLQYLTLSTSGSLYTFLNVQVYVTVLCRNHFDCIDVFKCYIGGLSQRVGPGPYKSGIRYSQTYKAHVGHILTRSSATHHNDVIKIYNGSIWISTQDCHIHVYWIQIFLSLAFKLLSSFLAVTCSMRKWEAVWHLISHE